MNHRRPVPALGVAIGLCVLVAACGSSGKVDTPAAPTRPATKDTCPSPTVAADGGLQLVDRQLVGFGPTVLGVEEQYSGSGVSMRVFSGGYFDEITEPYDTISPVGTIRIRGADASIFAGPYQDTTVRIALWREEGVQPPCDAHAVVATGIDEAQFDAVLNGLT